MSCRYCGYETGHSINCPARPRADFEKTSIPKQSLGGGKKEFYSGKEYEFDLFGKINTRDPQYLAKLKQYSESNGYVKFDKALKLAKEFQPGDPTNPSKDFLRELRIALSERMEDEEPDSVKAYTAIGTPLDQLHGIDAFVSGKVGGQEAIVTLDATLRPEKELEGGKADVIIGVLPDAEDDEDAYLSAISRYADEVARKLRSQKQEKRP